MPKLPASFCESQRWIGEWPQGRVFDEWRGKTTAPPSVEDFRTEFTELVRSLGGGECELPAGQPLDETKLAAQRMVVRLIVQNGEVPAGWDVAFRSCLPGYAEPFVSCPSHPVRLLVEVLAFMDHELEQAYPKVGWFSPPPDWTRGKLQSGIKGALVWLAAHGHVEPHTLIRLNDLPDDLIELPKLFSSVRATVEALGQSPQRTGGKTSGELEPEMLAGGGHGGKTPSKVDAASNPNEPGGDKPKLQRCQKLAYYASQYAEWKRERKLSALEVYEHWKDPGFDPADKDTENAAELAEYKLPDTFATFETQLSIGRGFFNDRRNESRKGRTGRSIVGEDEI